MHFHELFSYDTDNPSQILIRIMEIFEENPIIILSPKKEENKPNTLRNIYDLYMIWLLPRRK